MFTGGYDLDFDPWPFPFLPHEMPWSDQVSRSHVIWSFAFSPFGGSCPALQRTRDPSWPGLAGGPEAAQAPGEAAGPQAGVKGGGGVGVGWRITSQFGLITPLDFLDCHFP